MSEEYKQLKLPDFEKLIKDVQKKWGNRIEVLPTGRKRVHRVKTPSSAK